MRSEDRDDRHSGNRTRTGRGRWRSYDVVIIGAGFSGIGAAYRIAERNPPGVRYVVLERRDRIGGTWDLFRYPPGVRSDSSIFSLSWPWEPWVRKEGVADGDHIREYMDDTAHKRGIFPQHPLQHPCVVGRLGFDDRHLDCAHRRERHPQDLPRPLRVLRVGLLQLRRGLHPPTSRASRTSRAPSCIRSSGPKISTTPARR